MVKKNEERILALIETYRNGKGSFRAVTEELSPYIRHIPLWLGDYDEDNRSAFYLFVFERLEPSIRKYKKDPLVKFYTWFNVVLIREYRRFIRKMKKREVLFSPELLDQMFVAVKDDWEYTSLSAAEIRKSIDMLPRQSASAIKLHYGIPLSKDDIVSISKFRKIPILNVLEGYRTYLDNYALFTNSQIEKEEKVAKSWEKVQNTIDPLHPQQDKHQKRLEKFYIRKRALPIRYISPILGISDNATSVAMLRGRRILKALFEDKV